MKTRPYKLDLQLFAEDQPETPPTDLEQNYIEVIKELKENSVPKEDYDRVLDENKRLLNEYLNGGEPVSVPEEEKITEAQLREDLYGGKKELTNLEYWDKTIKLREMVMARGQIDPAVPVGHKYKPTSEDFAVSAKVFAEIGECVKAADGDPAKFNDLLDAKIIGGIPRAKSR